MTSPCILLVDNGSLQPEATRSLRSMASKLSELTGHEINPVSLLHSSKIAASELDGIAAETVETFIKKQWATGVKDFIILPLFFGPSGAIKDYLPKRIELLQYNRANLSVKIADCLVDPNNITDTRLAIALGEIVQSKIEALNLTEASIALVDHGSPKREVTLVRDHLAEQLQAQSNSDLFTIAAASMERREGIEYNFNEPLLENLLGSDGFRDDIILLPLFFSPGRHAGPGGDIDQICLTSQQQTSSLEVHKTDLAGTHPVIITLLAERLHCILEI